MPSTLLSLTLSIGAPQGGAYPVVATLSSGAQHLGQLRLPTRNLDYIDLAQVVLSAAATPSEDDIIAFGQILFGALFNGPLYTELQTARTADYQQGATLRIILDIPLALPEVAAIPWEFACADSAGLALFAAHPLCHYLATNDDRPSMLVPSEERLTILLAAGPTLTPAGEAAIAQELTTVQAALAPWAVQQKVRVIEAPRITALQLQRLLIDVQPHLIHLVAEPALDGTEPMLVLADTAGAPAPITVRQLGILLRGSSVRCVVVNVPHLGSVTGAMTRSLPPVCCTPIYPQSWRCRVR